jgi:DNA-binding CsgD family transcriptional regulator
MFVHLVRIQTAEAGQTLSWYLKSCEFQARNFLGFGRGVDSPAPAVGSAPVVETSPIDNGASRVPSTVAIEIQGERITSDVVNRILPRLSDMQQEILFLLMKGCGVRETGREVGITHPAVIKHRKKIARVAREVAQEYAVAPMAAAGHNVVAQSN